MTGPHTTKKSSHRVDEVKESSSPHSTLPSSEFTFSSPSNFLQTTPKNNERTEPSIFSGFSKLAISTTPEDSHPESEDSDDISSDEESSDDSSGDIDPEEPPLAHIAPSRIKQNMATSSSPLISRPKPSLEDEEARLFNAHLGLLKTATGLQNDHEVKGTPIFTAPVLQHSRQYFSQYGFFAGLSSVMNSTTNGVSSDPRVFFNISAPSSAFICGSQGSGKSHTLSCLLENCLMKSDVSKLDHPLAGLVFHYDTFTNDHSGTPCEAAYLASNPKIKVRVLCSPTNIETIKRTYAGLNVTIEALRINQSDLTTKRMMDLMAVNPDDGPMPLYLHAITRILRDLRIEQQQTNEHFNYLEFKQRVEECAMTPAQLMPLTQRLDTLESFMPKSQTAKTRGATSRKKMSSRMESGIDWSIRAGTLTIVDLSCPCVTSEGACALFNMCLSLFLEQKNTVGRVIALDEAHKYMNSATEATTLTQTLLSSIRLQRHLGTRVFISTQEPTISPALLDLCSITIVHRFSSPEWLKCLRQHLAALDKDNLDLDVESEGKERTSTGQKEVFGQIVKLRVGEALLFAPSAIVGVEKRDAAKAESVPGVGAKVKIGEEVETRRLGVRYLKIKIRARLTADGGKSVMAN